MSSQETVVKCLASFVEQILNVKGIGSGATLSLTTLELSTMLNHHICIRFEYQSSLLSAILPTIQTCQKCTATAIRSVDNLIVDILLNEEN